MGPVFSEDGPACLDSSVLQVWRPACLVTRVALLRCFVGRLKVNVCCWFGSQQSWSA